MYFAWAFMVLFSHHLQPNFLTTQPIFSTAQWFHNLLTVHAGVSIVAYLLKIATKK